ncbi:MAG: magnesium transporter [Bryobacterales bacterium]|nr:magnesium transporter [Bryobacterales bacterium]
MRGTETNDAGILAQQWLDMTDEERVAGLRSLGREEADELFLRLSTFHQLELLLHMPTVERRTWLRLLAPDDAADLIQAAEGREPRENLLDLLDEAGRREVNALMAYKQDRAGGLMNPRFARVRPEMTADEAIAYLRLQAGGVETIYYVYVLDQEQRLLGVLSFRDLFNCPKEQAIQTVMRGGYLSVSDEADQEAVAALFADSNLLAIPVLDEAGRMKGIITVDDIVDVVAEEASEDIHKFGGTQTLDLPYMEAGLWSMIRKRAGWLAILFVGEMLTATAMARYEDYIARAVVLAVFVPLIISSGGNAGSQAATLVIRAMALGELRLRDWWRVLWREIPSGLALGSVLALLGVTRILVWQAVSGTYGQHAVEIAATIGFSLIGVVLWGSLVGSLLPFLLRGVGLDPASASAPFVATMVDVCGLIIYFGVAGIVLRGTLL